MVPESVADAAKTIFPTPIYSRPASSRRSFVLLTLLQITLAVMPLLPMLALYAFAWRVAGLIGHWPVAWVDDPKFVAMGDWWCDTLYSFVMVFTCLATLTLPSFPLITWLRRRHYPRRWTIMLLGVFVLGWLFTWSDPSALWRWYFD